jgi:hypothetical protein
MKLQRIHETLDAAGLHRLSKDQLLRIARSPAGKKLADALIAFAAGEAAARRTLDLVVRSVSSATSSLAQSAGLRFPDSLATELALADGENFFKTLAAAAAVSSSEGKIAFAYLTAAGAVSTAPSAPPYYSFKVFGRAAALCFTEARTRNDNVATVNVEGALAMGEPGRVTYDWRSKIIIQLSATELLQVLALFEQKISQLRLDGHGRGHDKFLHLDVQDGNYFVKMAQKGRPAVAVPVTPGDAMRVTSLLYRQILLNEPHLDVHNVGGLLDRMTPMLQRQHR